MFNWIKNLLGISSPATDDASAAPYKLETPVVDSTVNWPFPTEDKPAANDAPVKEQAKTVAKPKKQAKKPAKKVAIDFDAMSKTELLAYAKTNGVKANASLKKEEILDRIKNG